MQGIKEKVQITLRDSIDPAFKSKRFFKTGPGEYAEFDAFLGIRTPVLRQIAKDFGKDLSLDEIKFFLESKFNEERLFALIVLVLQYKKADAVGKENIYQFYLKNIQQVNNWNLVDSSAHHILGAHLWDKKRDILLEFAQSEHMWVRRIALVTTLYFIKRQDFKWTITIVKVVLNDTHDLIHKAAGWMLKEMGEQNKEELLVFLDAHSTAMPRTMLRCAVEKLSADTRRHYLK